MSLPDSTVPDSEDPALNGLTRPSQTSTVLQIGVSLVLSVLVLGIIGYVTFEADAFRELLQNMQPGLLVGAVVVACARVWIGGERMRYVSQGRLGIGGGIRGQLAWDFFSSITPTVLGGGPVAAFYVARDEDLRIGDAAALMFFCMLLNQLWFSVAIPVVLGASLFVDLIPTAAGTIGRQGLILSLAGLFIWSFVFAYATLIRPRLLVEGAGWLTRWPFLRRYRERIMREMRSYFRRARRLGRQSAVFYGWGFFLTALIWLSRYVLVVIIVKSVYAGGDAVLLFLRSAAMMLVSLLMVTPGGSGGIEGLYVLFIGPLIPEAMMAPTLLAWRLLGFYIFIAIGAFLFVRQIQSNAAS